MAGVKLVNIQKTFIDERSGERITALQDVNLDISDHEFVTLTGPSECGKTTMLRLIMGLEEPDTGEVLVSGVQTNGKDRNPVSTGMVFQSGSLYPHMTIYKNLGFPLKKLRLSREEADRRIREAAELLKVTDLLQLKPKALSFEQNQRVAVARAIISSPDVVVMDEPLNRLDDQERGWLRTELIKLRELRRFTVIYAAFDLKEAMALGDRVVEMEKGRILSVRTPEELLKQLQEANA